MNGWTGIFVAKRHYVDDDARRLQFGGPYADHFNWTGLWCHIAECGALCVPLKSPRPTLQWCPSCKDSQARRGTDPVPPVGTDHKH